MSADSSLERVKQFEEVEKGRQNIRVGIVLLTLFAGTTLYSLMSPATKGSPAITALVLSLIFGAGIYNVIFGTLKVLKN